MGRPRQHDEHTAELLLDAAEQIVRLDGVSALNVRAVADLAGTTTRAIYSVFGGRELMLAALGARAFRLLEDALERFPESRDPAADLVEIGLRVFRRLLVVEHPVLFVLGVQQPPEDEAACAVVRAAADHAWPLLVHRVERLEVANPQAAATAYHALCEGLGAIELRGALRRRPAPVTWRASLRLLLEGLAAEV